MSTGPIAERQAFEAAVFRAPYLARLLDIAGEFTGRLYEADKESLLRTAMELLFEHRDEIRSANSIPQLWAKALDAAARSRPRWLVAISHYGVEVGREWIVGSQLRRRD